jgi:predicted phosphodiesterase
VLYDVHGNLAALEAVLDDARDAGTTRFILGGDYALFGPCPSETVEALRSLPDAIWIRGNVDRWSAHPDEADDPGLRAAIDACRGELGPAVAAELGALPAAAVLGGTRYCHASPLSDLRSFLPAPGEDDDEMLAGATERRIVFGHTHLAFRRTRKDGVELFNPGSVGMPLDGDHRAAYAILGDDGALEHRRVAYDYEHSASLVTARFAEAPWALRTAARLRTARLESTT